MEAAPFFEIASMLSEPQLIASVKVVADNSGNSEPDEAAAERHLGAAWSELKQVADRLVAMARRRRLREADWRTAANSSSVANQSVARLMLS